MAARDYGQYCGVTRGLELVGERWSIRRQRRIFLPLSCLIRC